MVDILDCTLRDGGFSVGFEFGEDLILKTTQNLVDSNVEVIEIGFLQSKAKYNPNSTLFPSLDHIQTVLDKVDKKNTKIAGFLQYPDFELENLIPNDKTLDLIRIGPRYSELEQSLEFIKQVSERGYQISIQPAITKRYTELQLNQCIDTANKINAFSLYIVDTFGFLTPEDVKHYCDFYHSKLNPDIKIGFHAHNNMNLAYGNSKFFKTYMTANYPERNIIIDSTLTGIGRGAGNTQTELLVPFLNYSQNRYNINKILDACEEIEKLNANLLWGYSMVDMVSALCKVHYEYSNYFKKVHKMSYSQIYDICKTIPLDTDLPYRYTKENAEKILVDYQTKN